MISMRFTRFYKALIILGRLIPVVSVSLGGMIV